MGRDAVEVAHEALIREWPTLRAWLAEDLEGLRTHRHFTEAALAWESRRRDRAELYRGARLAQAAEWAGAHPDELNTLEREFLTASDDEQTRRERELEEQRQRELAAAQRAAEAEQQRAAERGRLLRWIGVAAALLLVATIAATMLGSRYRAAAEEKTVLAEHNAAVAATAQAAEENALAAQAEESRQRSEADAAREAEAQQRAFAEEAQRAEAKQRAAAEAAEREAAAQRDAAEMEARQSLAMGLAGQAAVHQDKNSALALLLALEANAIHDTPQTRGALVSALEHSPGHVRFYGDHEDYVNGVAVSPDGSLLAVAEGARVYLRDPVTGERIGQPMSGSAGTQMHDAAFLAEGAILAALETQDSEAPSEMRFYEVSPTDGIRAELGSVVASRYLYLLDYWGTAATSPDGQRLAFAGCYEGFTTPGGSHYCKHGGVSLFDISDLVAGEGSAVEVASLDVVGQIHEVAISPDGKTVALGGCSDGADNGCNESFTLLWDPVSDEIIAREAFDAVGLTDVGALAYTPDGAHLVVAGCGANGVNSTCIQARADVWALDPVESVAKLVLDEADDMFYSVAVSADGWAVALGEFSPPDIYVWRPWEESLRPLPMVGHTNAVNDLAFSVDGRMLYSTGDDDLLGYWDLTLTGGIRSRLVREWQSITQVTYSPNGDIVATGSMGGIQLWDAETGELVRLLETPGPMDVQWGVSFSPDGRLLATGGITAGDIRLWDAETGEPVGEPVVPVPDTPAWSVAFSPDGKILAASGRHPLITLWDVDGLIAGEPVSRTLLGHAPDYGVAQVVFSPDGSRLASSGNDGTARFWDVATGEQVGDALNPDGGSLRSLAYSPDGTLLATACDDTNIRLWDAVTHDLIATLSGHDTDIWHIAFTPDGTMLLSIDDLGSLWLWDITDPANPGRAIAETNQGHLTWAYGLAVSPDSKTAVTTAQSGEIQQWHIDPAWWRERACAIADRNLTQAEWQQYLPNEPYRETCP